MCGRHTADAECSEDLWCARIHPSELVQQLIVQPCILRLGAEGTHRAKENQSRLVVCDLSQGAVSILTYVPTFCPIIPVEDQRSALPSEDPRLQPSSTGSTARMRAQTPDDDCLGTPFSCSCSTPTVWWEASCPSRFPSSVVSTLAPSRSNSLGKCVLTYFVRPSRHPP